MIFHPNKSNYDTNAYRIILRVLGKVTKHPIAVCVKPEWVIEKFVEKARKI